MENTSRIYEALMAVLRQCRRWVDYPAYENTGLDGNRLAADGEDQFVCMGPRGT